MEAVIWDAGDLVIVDQTLLPREERRLRLLTTEEVAEAIASLRVRGAPALGIAGAMGVAQAALRVAAPVAPSGRGAPEARDAAGVLRAAEEAGERLAAIRPTAVNLQWGIERVLARARRVLAEAGGTLGASGLAEVMAAEAEAIRREDAEACLAMARRALEFLPPDVTVLTHCHTGALCTGGIGTALGAIRLAHEEGRRPRVLACETRPLLQGARLTAWELGRLGIPHALIPDGAAAGLIARREVSLVMVGADRIAANGDVANKVGTYGHALAAREAGIPFVVVAPTSTIDRDTSTGDGIVVEERDPEEVTRILGVPIAPAGTAARNPAFDITPARLVTAIVTEGGTIRRPSVSTVASLLPAPASR